MKKVILFAAAMVAIVLASCSNSHETVYDSATKLWPAYDENTELYGYINAKGEWAIAPQYSNATLYFSNGYALVTVANGRAAFIDKKGNVQKADAFDTAEPFEYGYSKARLSGSYGYLDSKLSWAIQPVYDYIYMGPDHIATYSVGKKVGFITSNGQVLLKDGMPMVYDDAEEFVDGHCSVSDDASSYDKEGKTRVPTYYLIDKKGYPTISDGQYIAIYSMGESRIAAMTKPALKDYESGDWEREYMLLDLDGKVISAVKYQYMGSFYNGLALVATTGKTPQFGYINAKGEVVIACKYDEAQAFNSGYAIVEQDDVQKLINTKGEVVMTLNKDDHFRTYAHNGLIMIVKDHSSKTEDKYYYEWTEIETGKVVYSWETTKGKAPSFVNQK